VTDKSEGVRLSDEQRLDRLLLSALFFGEFVSEFN
jgi:hypothetical protein